MNVQKLGIYIRVSTVSQAVKGESPQFQKKQGIERANKEGLNYLIFDDSGKSGSSDKVDDRPELLNMLNDIKDGLLTHIWVQDESRLSRNEFTMAAIKLTIKTHNIKLLIGVHNEVNLNDLSAKLQFDVIALMNAFTASLNAQKSRLNKRERVMRGGTSGSLAYGYKSVNKKMVINEDEALIIKQIFELSINGYSYQNIAKYLNINNIGQSKKWTAKHCGDILNNEIYIGNRKFGNEIFKSPIIINAEIFNNCHKGIKKRSLGTKARVKNAFIYNNFIQCGGCGELMRGHSRSRGRGENGNYKCLNKQCNIKGGLSIDVLHYLFPLLITKYYKSNTNTLDVTKGIAELKGNMSLKELDISELINKIEDLNNKKKRLGNIYLNDIISESDFKLKIKEIDKKINELERQIAQNQYVNLNDKTLNDFITSLNFEDKVKILNNEVSRLRWYNLQSNGYTKGLIILELKHNGFIGDFYKLPIFVEYQNIKKMKWELATSVNFDYSKNESIILNEDILFDENGLMVHPKPTDQNLVFSLGGKEVHLNESTQGFYFQSPTKNIIT